MVWWLIGFNIIIRESKKAVRKLPLFPLPPSPRLLPLVYPFVLDQFPRSRISNFMNNQQKEHPKISPRRDALGRERNESLSPPRLAFLAWGDFHAPSRFARSTIPEENWGLLVVYLKGRLLSSIAFEFRMINEIERF